MDEPDIPAGNGEPARRERSGEVRGSGMGAGGGQVGEDFDGDPATGDGYPLTGGEGGPDVATDGVDRETNGLHPDPGDR